MTDVKFRFWDFNLKIMVPDDYPIAITSKGFIYDLSHNRDKPYVSQLVPQNTNIKGLLFTGIIDKNGVEIYVDDLFNGVVLLGHPTKGSSNGGSYWVKCLAKVELINGSFKGVAIKQLTELDKDFNVPSIIIDLDSNDIVIGNIYENAQLLNKEAA